MSEAYIKDVVVCSWWHKFHMPTFNLVSLVNYECLLTFIEAITHKTYNTFEAKNINGTKNYQKS